MDPIPEKYENIIKIFQKVTAFIIENFTRRTNGKVSVFSNNKNTSIVWSKLITDETKGQ